MGRLQTFQNVTTSLALAAAICAGALVASPRTVSAQAGGESAPSASAPRIDERATRLMRRSAEFLAGQNAMSFNWFVSYDEIVDDREKLTFMRSGSNLLFRDKGFYSRAEGENGVREWRYDGQQVTFSAPAERYFASAEFKEGFDALVDKARENMGSEIPLYAIMRRGLPDRLNEGLTGAAYLGITTVAGQEVHHVAFSDENEDWQVWISTEEARPVPVVIIGTEPKKRGWPQYRAYLTDWNFSPEYDPAVFKHVPGPSDVKVSFPDLAAMVPNDTQDAAPANAGAPANSGSDAATEGEERKQ